MRTKMGKQKRVGNKLYSIYINRIKDTKLNIMMRTNYGFYITQPHTREKDLAQLIEDVKKLINMRVAAVCYLHNVETIFQTRICAAIASHKIDPVGCNSIAWFYTDIMHEISQLNCKTAAKENLMTVLAADLQEIGNH
jgi:hypothetical protein